MQESVEFVHGLQGDWAVRAHTRLCTAMLKGGGKGGDLLHALGPSQALSVVYLNFQKQFPELVNDQQMVIMA